MKRLSFILLFTLLSAPLAATSGEVDLDALFDNSEVHKGESRPVVTSREREVEKARVAIASDKFDRIDGKTPCYYLYKKNNYQTDDDIMECRIRQATRTRELREQNTQACRALTNGVEADYKACLANRGTSQKSIDERREYIADLKKAEAKARREGKLPPGVSLDFRYTKKNSKIRTFHFWEILEQHQVPILYGRTKKPLIRVRTYINGKFTDNARGLDLYNTPDQVCQMMRDENGDYYHKVWDDPAGQAYDIGRPESAPFRTILRDYDGQEWNDGNRYKQTTDIIGIGEDGEYIEKRQGEDGRYYFSYVVITCVRKLNDGEEPNAQAWKDERDLLENARRRREDSYKEMFDFRRNGGASKDEPVTLSTPIILPDGTIIYESGGSDPGDGRSHSRNYNSYSIGSD